MTGNHPGGAAALPKTLDYLGQEKVERTTGGHGTVRKTQVIAVYRSVRKKEG
jgi:hypothetical protein